MARNVAALLLAAGLASCMEMRETVERMVMVRTTGSDLQPAATGYIYKKESNGPESVIEMEESEVMEHLSKLYEKPDSFAAPVPAAAGPFYEKEEDVDKAASHTDGRVIPVVEKAEDNDEHDTVDGIADDDFPKFFKEYTENHGKYNNDFADYLHGLGQFDHGIYHGYSGDGAKGYDDHDDKGYKGYASKHHYGKGDAGDYHTEKYESYSISEKGGSKKAKNHEKHYDEGHTSGDGEHKEGHKVEAINGYNKDSDEYKKDYDVHHEDKKFGGFSKHADGHTHKGSGAGDYENGDTYESGHVEGDFGKKGFHQQKHGDHRDEHSHVHDGESNYHKRGFEGKIGKYGGKSFGFKIDH